MAGLFKYQFGRKEALAILLIFILAIVLRIIYLKDYAQTKTYSVSPHSDSYSYYVWARDIESGDLMPSKAFMKWPLYAYFLGSLFKISGHNLFFIYFLQFILGAVNCLLVYFIARTIFNKKVGFISALLYIWYGLFIFYEGLLVYTSLSLFLNLLLFLFILGIRENPGKKSLFATGIFLGISTITQANIAIFGVLAVSWILITKKLNWRKLLSHFSCFLIGLCVVVGSVTLINYLVEKDSVLIAGNLGFNFYLGNNKQASGIFSCPDYISLNQEDMFRDARIIANINMGRDLKTSEVSSFWFNKAMKFIRENPLVYLKLLFKKITYIFNPKEFNHDIEYTFLANKIGIFKIMFMDLRFILPLGLLGMFLGLKRFKETLFLYIILITLAFSISLFFVATRYRMAMVPFLIIFAGFAVYRIWVAFREKNYLRFGLLFVVLAVLFISLNRDIVFAKNTNAGLKSKSNLSSFDSYLYKALEYENNSEYQKAIVQLVSASKIKPNDYRIIFRMGVIYYNIGDFKTAEWAFKSAIEINPLSVDAYYNLGFMYNKQQRFTEARGVLERAVFLDSENAHTHFELGVAYKATGDIQKAREEFNLALKNLNRWRHEDRAAVEEELRILNN